MKVFGLYLQSAISAHVISFQTTRGNMSRYKREPDMNAQK